MPIILVKFNIRCYPKVSLETLGGEVGTALGCTFAEGRVEQVPSLVANLLGMEVSLQPWAGQGERPIVRLRGDVLDPRFLGESDAASTPEFTAIDVSEYMLTLMAITTDQEWYLPTDLDVAAEWEHGRKLDEAY